MNTRRVLVISHVIPRFPGPGAETRAFCLTRHLSDKYDITWLLPDYGPNHAEAIRQLKAVCHVETYPATQEKTRLGWLVYRLNQSLTSLPVYKSLSRKPQLVWTIKNLLPTLITRLRSIDWEAFDLFHVVHPHTAYALKHIAIPIPKTLDWVDERTTLLRRKLIHQSWGKKLSSQLEIGRVEQYQRWVAQRFDTTFIASPLDAERMARCTPGKTPVVIPNGVDSDYFNNPVPGRPESNILVFTGHMSYEPNVEAVLFFCREILPVVLSQVADARLFVVGTQPHPAIQELERTYAGKVIVTGEVPDVRPYLMQAAISIAPLRNGGGTRLKILEAMAMHRPVVTTPVGCEGLQVQAGHDLLIRDTPNDFAQAVIHLLQDVETWQHIAARGQALVQWQYSWQTIAASMAKVWEQTIERDTN